MIPTPKYQIGDKVFVADCNFREIRTPCPDCLGTKKWAATTAAGGEFQIDCGTCMNGYFAMGTLSGYEYVPEAVQRTIGSILLDTADDDGPYSYMCTETGVGSGQVYRETDVFDTHEAAMIMASVKAAEARANRDKRRDDEEDRKRRSGSLVGHYRRKILQMRKEIERMEARITIAEAEAGHAD